MTQTNPETHQSDWSAPVPPPSGAHGDANPNAIWQTELSLLDGIITQVRALRQSVEHSSQSTMDEPVPGKTPADQPAGTIAPVLNDVSPVAAENLSPPMQPIVVAVLPAVDPETGEPIDYELVDANGASTTHSQFELVGHELLLRANTDLPEADSGCATLHLRVTSETGVSTVEEFVLRLDSGTEGADVEEDAPASDASPPPNIPAIITAIDEPI